MSENISFSVCGVGFEFFHAPKSWSLYVETTANIKPLSGSEPLVVRCFVQEKDDLSLNHEKVVTLDALPESPFISSLLIKNSLRATHISSFENIEFKIEVKKDAAVRSTMENFVRIFLSHFLPCSYRGLMLHASCGVDRDQVGGVVFAGVSGAGKTTMSDAFRETTYLSDDISMIRFSEEGAVLMPSPFHGKSERPQADLHAPLRAMGILGEKASGPSELIQLNAGDALKHLMRHVVSFSHSSIVIEKTVNAIEQLCKITPVFYIKRNLNDFSADEVVSQLISKSQIIANEHKAA